MAESNIHGLAFAVAYVTFAFGLLTSICRFYSRAVLVKQWGWDDSFSVLVMVVSIIHQWVLQLFLDLGCGEPALVECSFASLKLLKTAFIQEIVIYGAHCVIKVTFLLFYLRLNQELDFRKWVVLGFVLNGSVFVTNLFLTVFQCIPFEKILNPALHPDVKCLDQFTVMMVPPILNIAMDLYIIGLPITTIWKLQMTLRRKLTILSVLGFGIISVTVAILRLPVLVSVTSGTSDVSVDVGRMIIVAAFEVQCAIVASNLPSLKAMWTTVRTRLGFSGSSNDHAGSNGYKLSTRDGRTGGGGEGSKGLASAGVVTRLERGLTSNESEEELFKQGTGQPRVNRVREGEIGEEEDAKGESQSIVVTTGVDVVSGSVDGRRHMPRSYLGISKGH